MCFVRNDCECVSIAVGLQKEIVPPVKEKEKVKKHSVDITLMVYSGSVLSHYVVVILIFSSSLTKTEAVWFFSTDKSSISLRACLNILRVHKV